MNPRRAQREALGLTQLAAAALAGVGFATWRRWEDNPDAVKPATRRACELALQTYEEAQDLGLDLKKFAEGEQLRLFTIDQAAERLSCSRSHVYRLIEEGALRVVDISSSASRQRKTRVFGPDIDVFIQRRLSDHEPRTDGPGSN